MCVIKFPTLVTYFGCWSQFKICTTRKNDRSSCNAFQMFHIRRVWYRKGRGTQNRTKNRSDIEQSTENASVPITPKLVVQTRQRRGKGIGLSLAESILMLREVYAQKVYIDPHGYKQKGFKNVADALNCNTDLK